MSSGIDNSAPARSSIPLTTPAGHTSDRSLSRAIDGLSLMPHLKSGGTVKLQRDDLLWHFPHYRHAPGPYSIIRQGDHKLIKFWAGPFELYDLGEDLAEANNLAAAMPKRVSELDTLLLKRLRETGARLPRRNPDFARK